MAQCEGTYGPHQHLVDAPVVNPYRFGALSAFNITEPTDDHERNGIVYKSTACVAAIAPWVDNCDSGAVLLKEPTDAGLDAEASGCPIHLLTVLSCKTTTLEAMFQEALDAFKLAEQSATEAAVWGALLENPAAVILNTVPGEAGAFSLLQGLALLESAIADCYPGQATIHGDRGVGTYAADVMNLIRNGGSLETALGSKWALYGGGPNTGPDGLPAPDGHAWLYATSNVSLRRFPIETRPSEVGYVLLKNPDGGQTNEPRVIVERTIVPSIECCILAALVCLSC